jgi:hypothetical protein
MHSFGIIALLLAASILGLQKPPQALTIALLCLMKDAPDHAHKHKQWRSCALTRLKLKNGLNSGGGFKYKVQQALV